MHSQQPTAFTLSTHHPTAVLDDPQLLESVKSYAGTRDSSSVKHQMLREKFDADNPRGNIQSSTVLLQVNAAAEYFSTNSTLMTNVPPVFVDVILDPHFVPGVPRSLVPAIVCISVVAVVSFILAWWISLWMVELAAGKPDEHRKTE